MAGWGGGEHNGNWIELGWGGGLGGVNEPESNRFEFLKEKQSWRKLEGKRKRLLSGRIVLLNGGSCCSG